MRSALPESLHGEKGAALAGLEVAQVRIQYFFYAAEFGAPQIAHVVEAAVNCVEAGVDVPCDQANYGGVEQHRYADGKIER